MKALFDLETKELIRIGGTISGNDPGYIRDLTEEELSLVTAGGAYTVVKDTEAGLVRDYVELTDDLINGKREEISKARYNAEVGGIEVDGVPVRTDRVTQSILGNARQYAKEDNTFSTDWKLSDGTFVTLTAPQIIAFADAVLAHVQAQFTKEKLLNDQIDAVTTTEELKAVKWS